MAAKKEPQQETVPDSKIRNAIWYLKQSKTKKFVCEYLGIAYNTKKLDKLIEDFLYREQREKELKAKAKITPISLETEKSIVKSYLNGDAQSTIAKEFYISAAKVKSILIKNNVPIRARKRTAPAKTEHISQDLDIKFTKGNKVFYGPGNCFANITKVYDEQFVESLYKGRQRWVETYPWNESKSKYSEPVEGIHYEIYWELEDGTAHKLSSIKSTIKRTEQMIAESGREFYEIWIDGDYSCFKTVKREDLFPVPV